MARLGEQGIRLSSMSPSFLHSNSTSHTGPFSAVAELIDNAADPGVSAQRIWIDQTQEAGHLCISFTDDGFGMTPSKLHKMLSFGFTDKGLGKASQQAIGIYGNGFKSGSMRLGRDALIFTKNGGCQTVGLLSQTYLENIKAQAVMVPIVPFNQQTKSLVVTEDSKASLAAILQHSIVSSEKQIHTHFDSIVSKKGTKILIWNIRRDKDGKAEIDFMADNSDFRLPGIHKKKEKKDTSLTAEDNVPLMHYSLKAYLHILYLKPMIEIILRGKKVSAEPLRLTHTEYDEYNPQFSKEKVKVTFGMNHSNMEQYGIMMYYKNRLIKAYERVGFQLKISGKRAGKGVIGIIECNFLKPAHNKQDFDYSKEYRLTLAALGHKLNDYWKNIVNEETKEQEKKDTLDIQRAANNEQPQSRKWEMSSQEHQKLKCPPSKLVLCLNRLESVAMADRVKPVEKTSIVDHAVEDHAEGHTNTNVRPVTVITHLEQRSAGRTTNEEFFPQQAEIQTCDQWNGFEKNRNDTNVQTIEKDKEHRFKPRCKRKYDSCFSVMSKRLNLVKYQHVSGNGDAFHQESQRNTFSSVQSSLPPTQAGMVMVPLSQSDGIQGDQLLSEEKDREAELLKLALLQREVHRLQTLLGMGGINQTEGTMTAADSSTGNHRDIIVTSSAKREMDFQTDGAESSPAATGPHSEPQPAAELAAGQGCVFPGPKEVPKTYGLQKNRRNADGSLKVCDCDAAENSRSVWENLVKVRTNVVTLLTALLPQLDLTGISLETLDVDNILQQIIEVNSL